MSKIEHTRECDRGRQAVRIIETVLRISQRPYTLRQLAEKSNVSYKTVIRDIQTIERIGVPVVVERAYDDNAENDYIAGAPSNYYRIHRGWAKRFM